MNIVKKKYFYSSFLTKQGYCKDNETTFIGQIAILYDDLSVQWLVDLLVHNGK